MIFKVTYQPAKFDAPTRENTESLYVEASDIVIARRLVEQNPPYNIE
ncbi:MAG TPA: RNA polymerase epsilon subunit, partial [Trichococcus flocculiformis]|nr:RNA polymerase epsilon subunit [Trichococcus flocculiformis]